MPDKKLEWTAAGPGKIDWAAFREFSGMDDCTLDLMKHGVSAVLITSDDEEKHIPATELIIGKQDA